MSCGVMMVRLEWFKVRVSRVAPKSTASEVRGIERIGTGLPKEEKEDPSCGRRIAQLVTENCVQLKMPRIDSQTLSSLVAEA